MRVHLLRSLPLLFALAGCDDLESKTRLANEKRELARAEVQARLLPLASKGLPTIVPVTLDVRVDQSGKITKCLSNRKELPGCLGTELQHGENASFSFTMEEVAATRKVAQLRESK